MYNNHAALAYQQTRRAVVSGRDLESMLLLKAAARLQAVRDGWDQRQGELVGALTYNRKLWTVLVDLILKPTNPLPDDVKQNLANIAVFIFKQTIDIECEPQADKLAPLVDLNRTIAEGLRS
jgi:flagellar biosynthesis activator protein FlaF